MNENITVKVIDMTGAVGPIKAAQLARLIEAYIQKHPELVKEENE